MLPTKHALMFERRLHEKDPESMKHIEKLSTHLYAASLICSFLSGVSIHVGTVTDLLVLLIVCVVLLDLLHDAGVSISAHHDS